jgi:hypothetical protein
MSWPTGKNLLPFEPGDKGEGWLTSLGVEKSLVASEIFGG